MTFWVRLKERIKLSRTTQEWVAGRIGVPAQTFRRWSSSQTMPNAEQAVGIASALGVTVEWLVTGKDSTLQWEVDNARFLADCKKLHLARFDEIKRQVAYYANIEPGMIEMSRTKQVDPSWSIAKEAEVILTRERETLNTDK